MYAIRSYYAEEKSFFLLFKDMPDKTLLKADKISRPSPTHFVKRALQAYADAAGLEVLASNVDSREINMHLGNDSALWTIHDFRITSYNVCYTKLLRMLAAVEEKLVYLFDPLEAQVGTAQQQNRNDPLP